MLKWTVGYLKLNCQHGQLVIWTKIVKMDSWLSGDKLLKWTGGFLDYLDC